MSKSIVKMIKELVAPKVLIDTLRNQDSRELGADSGDAIKKFIYNEFGVKSGDTILLALRPWIDRFYLALRKELDGD